jgi:hypothetical protein
LRLSAISDCSRRRRGDRPAADPRLAPVSTRNRVWLRNSSSGALAAFLGLALPSFSTRRSRKFQSTTRLTQQSRPSPANVLQISRDSEALLNIVVKADPDRLLAMDCFDPRRGRGLFNTYPARLPGLRYPLDYVFHSPHFVVSNMQVLPRFQSNHLALAVSLVLKD